MQDRHRFVVAASSAVLLIAAWTAVTVVRPSTPDVAHAAQTVAVAAPRVHIDGLAVPEASPVRRTPAASPARTGDGGRPVDVAAVSVGSALPPSVIPTPARLAYMRGQDVLAEAKPSCHLSWPLLAGIGKIESDHGRYGGSAADADGLARPGIFGVPLNGARKTAAIKDTDGGRWDHDSVWDRAVGPMQFIPSTWAAVAVDANDDGVADPQNIYDAALAAGVYLCAGGDDLGTDAGTRAAVFSYNHSRTYVAQVLALAHAYGRGDARAVTALPQVSVPDLHRSASRPRAPEQREHEASHAKNREPVNKAQPSKRSHPSAHPKPPDDPTGEQTDSRPVEPVSDPATVALKKDGSGTAQGTDHEAALTKPEDGGSTGGDDSDTRHQSTKHEAVEDRGAGDTDTANKNADDKTPDEDPETGDTNTANKNADDKTPDEDPETGDTNTEAPERPIGVVCVIEDGELASCHDANDANDGVVEDYACTFDDDVLTLGKPTETDPAVLPVCELVTQ